MARNINGSDYGRFSNTGPSARANNFDRIAAPRALMAALYPYMYQDTVFVFDDFTGDTFDTFKWAMDGDTGTTNFAPLAEGSTVANGVIAGATSTDDNEAVSIRGMAVWQGDKNCGMEIRWRVVTHPADEVFFEMGFTDPLTDYTLPAINDIDTPTITNGAVTVAVLAMDPDQTLKTAAFVTDGDATYATAKVNVGTFTPTAANWYTTRIQLIGDTGICSVFDSNTPSARSLISEVSAVTKIEGGTLVQPWAIFGNRGTTGFAPQIDYIAVWQDR
jgi:hypothetical protein